MSSSVYQVDAFTNTPFAGNPAAVCLLSDPRSEEWMQNVAAEMNLSETAFLGPQREPAHSLRWFTPTHEVDLCGHATLASAHVLWTEGVVPPTEEARFETASGRLTAFQDDGWITMDFPADPPAPIEAPPAVHNGLDLPTPVYVGTGERDYILQYADEEVVRGADPDMRVLAGLERRGVIITSSSERTGIDFVSRYFAPGVGIPEDPVTGSAHCTLASFWAQETGRTTLTGHQVSARGGTVRVQLDSPTADRVALSGQAATVLRGRLEP